jgi:S1-C subfamily serine protease
VPSPAPAIVLEQAPLELPPPSVLPSPLQGLVQDLSGRIRGFLSPPPDRQQQPKKFTIGGQTLGITLIDEADGAVIRWLQPGSQAEALGVTIGGKITAVNGEAAATNEKDLNSQLASASRPTTLLIAPPAPLPAKAEQAGSSAQAGLKHDVEAAGETSRDLNA